MSGEPRVPCRHPLDYLIMKLMTHRSFKRRDKLSRVVLKPLSKAFSHVENLSERSILVGIVRNSSTYKGIVMKLAPGGENIVSSSITLTFLAS